MAVSCCCLGGLLERCQCQAWKALMGAFVALQLGMPYPLNGLKGPDINVGALQEQKAVQPGEELIIRLETISEKGLAEGHSLSVPSHTCLMLYAQCRTSCSSSSSIGSPSSDVFAHMPCCLLAAVQWIMSVRLCSMQLSITLEMSDCRPESDSFAPARMRRHDFFSICHLPCPLVLLKSI